MALVRIYSLLYEYQTLVREIATPTLPAFATACLQLVKPPGASKQPQAPASLVETVTSALAAVVTLYPTTLRPFNAQIRAAVRPYLAPASASVPSALRNSSRRLVALLPFTAPKNSSADEWAKALDALIADAHKTADQIFRAVQESWEPTADFAREKVPDDGEPQGGGDAPRWTAAMGRLAERRRETRRSAGVHSRIFPLPHEGTGRRPPGHAIGPCLADNLGPHTAPRAPVGANTACR